MERQYRTANSTKQSGGMKNRTREKGCRKLKGNTRGRGRRFFGELRHSDSAYFVAISFVTKHG
jgi:hypothetical protein